MMIPKQEVLLAPPPPPPPKATRQRCRSKKWPSTTTTGQYEKNRTTIFRLALILLSLHNAVLSFPFQSHHLPRRSLPTRWTTITNNRWGGGSTLSNSLSPAKSNLEVEPYEDDHHSENDDDNSNKDKNEDIVARLSSLLGIEPTILESRTNSQGIRGVYTKDDLEEGEPILMVPLNVCLCDQRPPDWMNKEENHHHDDDDEDDDEKVYSDYQSPWATQLAASLVDLKLQQLRADSADNTNTNEGLRAWLSCLPNPDYLRASLPVHWPESIVQSARCTAFELAVDSAYFAREESVGDLLTALQQSREEEEEEDRPPPLVADTISAPELRRICDDALDIVQTRSCRLEVPPMMTMMANGGGGRSSSSSSSGIDPPPPFGGGEGPSSSSILRVLAPVFDLINHAETSSGRRSRRFRTANAVFGLERIPNQEEKEEGFPQQQQGVMDLSGLGLVVRASRKILAEEEVLIDYGPSTAPGWKCLTSYGFVPNYVMPSNRDDGDDDNEEEEEHQEEEEMEDDDDDDDSTTQSHHLAEVYMDGIRYEVGPSHIPVDLVSAAASSIQAETYGFLQERREPSSEEDEELPLLEEEDDVTMEEPVLTPEVALRIATRLSTVAFQLLLDDKQHDLLTDDEGEEEEEDPCNIISSQLAASLRFSQHRILMACAMGIRGWIAEASTGGQE